jgi:hypothetical protein
MITSNVTHWLVGIVKFFHDRWDASSSSFSSYLFIPSKHKPKVTVRSTLGLPLFQYSALSLPPFLILSIMSSDTNHPVEPAVETVDKFLFAPPAAPGDDNEIPIGTREEGDYAGDQVRRDISISSALFKMLSIRFSGGFLTLPLAFQQSGNSHLGPLMLIMMAFITDVCFHLLVF